MPCQAVRIPLLHTQRPQGEAQCEGSILKIRMKRVYDRHIASNRSLGGGQPSSSRESVTVLEAERTSRTEYLNLYPPGRNSGCAVDI